MTDNFSERIENALNDIQILQMLYRQKYGEECLTDKEIEEILKIVKAEHEEIRQYRAIGTVDECRAAMKKQKPKAPDIWGDGYDGDGNMIYDMYDCPNCGKSYEIECDNYKYCPECGQAIDRSALEE